MVFEFKLEKIRGIHVKEFEDVSLALYNANTQQKGEYWKWVGEFLLVTPIDLKDFENVV